MCLRVKKFIEMNKDTINVGIYRYPFDADDLDFFLEFLMDFEDGVEGFEEEYPEFKINISTEMGDITNYIVVEVVKRDEQ